ncbi:MAG TPA: PIN domain-containing protein [Bryobacteraceae bacterium]|jgi:predicted nucleic acid-binding protein
MRSLAFFDTNILVYCDDAAVPSKRDRAIHLFAEHQRSGLAVISLQVMQEYFSAITRKLGVDAELAQRKVEILARGRVVRFTEDDVIGAIELHRLTRISFWDAMIVRAAKTGGAGFLYSEDLQHGSVIGGVKVINPFV